VCPTSVRLKVFNESLLASCFPPPLLALALALALALTLALSCSLSLARSLSLPRGSKSILREKLLLKTRR